jgi:lysophospholipase L1-like esterase
MRKKILFYLFFGVFSSVAAQTPCQYIEDCSLAIMGSSVPSGTGADTGKGYAQLFQKYLENDAVNSWRVINISIPGNNTTDVMNRWNTDLLPACTHYVYFGLSLGNEGIHEKGQSAFDSWRDNMQTLINRAREAGKIPLLGNNYPRGDFNTSDYNYIKELNLLVHEWDVPSVNLLGAIDNGAGQWASGYMADNAHPNTAGHAEMFYAIVPSLMDALAAGKPQPVRKQHTSLVLTKDKTVKRIAFSPENILHSFTLTFSFKTTGAGNISSFVTENGDTAHLVLGSDGKLTYKGQASVAALNDGNWHTVSLTHYYAQGVTQLYIDGARIPRSRPENEKLVPIKFFLNDFENAPQLIEYSELFFHRAGMCAEEIAALYQGKMLKSSLEIYAPFDVSSEKDVLFNAAQSLNTLSIDEENTLSGWNEIPFNKNQKIKEITFYSLLGQRLFHTMNIDSDYTKKISAGIYVVKILSDRGEIKSQKIVIDR